MKNPFSFSGVVEDTAFCNRKKEQDDLAGYIRNAQNVLLYSHRRYGKTSLICKVLSNLTDIPAVYVDLYGTTSVEDFIRLLFKGFSQIETGFDRLRKLIRETFTSISVSFSFDMQTGAPTAVPSFAPDHRVPILDEVFAFLESLSKKRPMVVVLDEFQEISRYDNDPFEKQLRKRIQRHNRISYIFSGSRKSLLNEMFSDSKRAFYQLATPYPLEKIKTLHYLEWIRGLYAKSGQAIYDTHINNVIKRCENHPMYIQEFFYHLWEAPEPVSVDLIDQIGHDILRRREAEYINIFDNLTLNQKKTMKLVAATGGKNLFSSDALVRFGLKTASQANVALKVLEKKEHISKNGTYYIQDPLFRQWIQRL